jgi:hypothetical protein
MPELDLTIDKIADGVGVRSLTARRWINGDNSPKSHQTLKRIVDFMESEGATDYPAGYRRTSSLPLDDQEGDSIYLITHSNPIIEREGAEFALKNLISEERSVIYVILSFDFNVFDLELFPFFRSVIKRLEYDGMSANKIQNLLNIYIMNEDGSSILSAVSEAMLGSGVLIANLSVSGDILSASLMQKTNHESLSRTPVSFSEERIFPNPKSFDKIVKLVKQSNKSLMKLDTLRIAESPFEYVKEINELF